MFLAAWRSDTEAPSTTEKNTRGFYSQNPGVFTQNTRGFYPKKPGVSYQENPGIPDQKPGVKITPPSTAAPQKNEAVRESSPDGFVLSCLPFASTGLLLHRVVLVESLEASLEVGELVALHQGDTGTDTLFVAAGDVEGAGFNMVTLYDVSGRILATKRDDNNRIWFDVPTSGTYLLKISDYPARKLVVIR